MLLSAPHLKTWFSKRDWDRRIITTDPSWFTVAMSTGVCTQILIHLPYHENWMRNLAYCFWILEIVVFALFTALGCIRAFRHPYSFTEISENFAETSYFGAIVIAWEIIIFGVISFYQSRSDALYVAEVIYWISVVGSVFVAFGGVYFMYSNQREHGLGDINGAWFLTWIPCIVCSTVGGARTSSLSQRNGSSILVTSFLLWSVGIAMSTVLLPIYLWRLMSAKLPPAAAIVSTFVPIGPYGIAAYSIQQLAYVLARRVKAGLFLDSTLAPNLTTLEVVSEGVNWLGILVVMFLLGIGSFWLVEACLSVGTRVPGSFNVGFWSFVFPCGVYANAWNLLGTNLRNDGLKRYGAACSVATLLLWLFCAVMSAYTGIWEGDLLNAPGLHGMMQKQEIERLDQEKQNGGRNP